METITIRPETRYWVLNNAGSAIMFILSLGLIIASFVAPGPVTENLKVLQDFEGGRGVLRLAGLGLLALTVLKSLYSFLSMKCMKWVITPEFIEIHSGIIARNRDHLELYRVCDYAEEQSVFERLFFVKKVILISTDKTDRRLEIVGVSSGLDLISTVRERVEICRGNRRVYESGNS